MNIYYDPEKFGLEQVGEIDFSSGAYEFDLTVVWRRVSDDALVYAEDSGCSCPSPFESTGVDELIVLRKGVNGLNDFKAAMEKRDAAAYDEPGSRGPQIVALLERMHAAGAR